MCAQEPIFPFFYQITSCHAVGGSSENQEILNRISNILTQALKKDLIGDEESYKPKLLLGMQALQVKSKSHHLFLVESKINSRTRKLKKFLYVLGQIQNFCLPQAL